MPRKRKTTTRQHANEILFRVRARLQRGWIQGPAANDRYGHSVDVDSPQACGWCLIGAVWVEERSSRVRVAVRDLVRQALDQAVQASRFRIFHQKPIERYPATRSIINFNETPGRRKRDVITLVERARQLVRTGKVL
jgi:hypothetical protein